MSFTLLHGPAGSGKTAFLTKEMQDHLSHSFLDDFVLIVPQVLRNSTWKRLMDASGRRGFFSEEAVTDFEDFLIRILKQNLSRVHLAPPLLSRNILRCLWSANNLTFFKNNQGSLPVIRGLFSAIQKLKSSGLTPETARMHLNAKEHPSVEHLCEVFSAYNQELARLGFLDVGDLYLETLHLLKRGALILPQGLKTIYADRLFPLLPGQREIIKRLAQISDIKVVLTHDYDYTAQEDPYLYAVYGELGEMADTNEYFHSTRDLVRATSHRFTDPAAETAWVAQTVRGLLSDGVKTEDIQIVIPPEPFYHERLSSLLTAFDIPHSPAASQSMDLAVLKNLGDDLAQTHGLTLKLHKLKEEFSKEWDFTLSLLSQNSSPLTERWKQEEIDLLSSQKTQEEGVRLLSLDDAAVRNTLHSFVVGYTGSRYPASRDLSLYYPGDLLVRPEMAEVLQSPRFEHIVAAHGLECLWQRAGTLHLSFPCVHWDGSQQTSSRLHLSTQILTSPTVAGHFEVTQTKIKQPEGPAPIKRNAFSLTDLELYATCPFKFYASKHLKLGDRPRDDVDIAGDVQGNFVHRVLERIYREHSDLYREALTYDVYLERLKKTARDLIDQEAVHTAFLKSADSSIRDPFLDRVHIAVSQHLDNEINDLKEKQKITFPTYFEWDFGRGDTQPLVISDGKTQVDVSGRIDRIDVDESGALFSVIDYKTGNLPSTTALTSGKSLQLILYAMAAEKFLPGNIKPASAYLLGLKENKKAGFSLLGAGEEALAGRTGKMTQDAWEELKKTATTKVLEIAQRVSQGDFDPTPEDQMCRSCDYRMICHANFNGDEESEASS